MEEALLIEADAVLAATLRRAFIARAANLRHEISFYAEKSLSLFELTFLLRQYLQAIAVRWRGAGAWGAA
jgi:hypothetical protein